MCLQVYCENSPPRSSLSVSLFPGVFSPSHLAALVFRCVCVCVCVRASVCLVVGINSKSLVRAHYSVHIFRLHGALETGTDHVVYAAYCFKKNANLLFS